MAEACARGARGAQGGDLERCLVCCERAYHAGAVVVRVLVSSLVVVLVMWTAVYVHTVTSDNARLEAPRPDRGPFNNEDKAPRPDRGPFNNEDKAPRPDRGPFNNDDNDLKLLLDEDIGADKQPNTTIIVNINGIDANKTNAINMSITKAARIVEVINPVDMMPVANEDFMNYDITARKDSEYAKSQGEAHSDGDSAAKSNGETHSDGESVAKSDGHGESAAKSDINGESAVVGIS